MFEKPVSASMTRQLAVHTLWDSELDVWDAPSEVLEARVAVVVVVDIWVSESWVVVGAISELWVGNWLPEVWVPSAWSSGRIPSRDGNWRVRV